MYFLIATILFSSSSTGGKVGGSGQLYGFLIFFRTENPENMMSPLEMQVDQQYVHPREIQKGMGKGMGKALGVWRSY